MPMYCITGANRGLGLEFTRQLAQSPENTILATTRSPPASASLVDLRTSAVGTIHILECDTSKLPSIHTFAKDAKRILNSLGGAKIDFLINNAGVNTAPWSESSLSLGPDDLAMHIAVNVLGPAKTVEFLLSAGLLSDSVRVLNMTSGLGSIQRTIDRGVRECAGYSISKAALNMLSVHQSGDLREVLPGAVVAVVDPGWVKTSMGGDDAKLAPSESVGAVLKVLHGLKDGDTGRFYHYSGGAMSW